MSSPYNPDLHHRRSIRLPGYSYTQRGAYFVTICTFRRQCLFGDVVDGEVRLNEAGRVLAGCWNAIPQHFANVQLDVFVVMPNHIHGIVVLPHVGATHASPSRTPTTFRRPSGPAQRSLGAIIGSFKSAVTKHINAMVGTASGPIWQRNYYERIIRSDDELDCMRMYIANNPLRWADDENNPDINRN